MTRCGSVPGPHALMAMSANVELDLPDVEYILSHDSRGTQYGQRFRLDDTGLLSNVSRPALLPDQQSWKVFAASPIGKGVTVRYPARSGLSVALNYHSDDLLAAYWGIWINTGGWMHHRHFAIEATSGRSDQLDRAIADHSAGSVRASGRITWRVSMTLGAG